MAVDAFNALSDSGFKFLVFPEQELSPKQQAIKTSLDHPGHPLNEAVRAIVTFGDRVSQSAGEIEVQGGDASELKRMVEKAGTAFLQVDGDDPKSLYLVLQPNVGGAGKMRGSYRVKLTSPKPAGTYRLDSRQGRLCIGAGE
jgi:hypothetical protein